MDNHENTHSQEYQRKKSEKDFQLQMHDNAEFKFIIDKIRAQLIEIKNKEKIVQEQIEQFHLSEKMVFDPAMKEYLGKDNSMLAHQDQNALNAREGIIDKILKLILNYLLQLNKQIEELNKVREHLIDNLVLQVFDSLPPTVTFNNESINFRNEMRIHIVSTPEYQAFRIRMSNGEVDEDNFLSEMTTIMKSIGHKFKTGADNISSIVDKCVDTLEDTILEPFKQIKIVSDTIRVCEHACDSLSKLEGKFENAIKSTIDDIDTLGKEFTKDVSSFVSGIESGCSNFLNNLLSSPSPQNQTHTRLPNP